MKRADLKFPVRASELARVKLCPGSARLASIAPVKPASEEASEGIAMHLFAGTALRRGIGMPGFHDFNDEQVSAVNLAVEKASQLVIELTKIYPPSHKIITDQELPFDKITDFGHADVLAHDGNAGLVIDFKFGRLPVVDAEVNMQMRAYAVGLAQLYGVNPVSVALIQPRAEKKVLGPVLYTKADLQASVDEIRAIIEASQGDDAQFHPSPEACQYCPAKAYCVAAQTHATNFALTIQHKGFILETPEQMGNFVAVAKAVKKLIDERLEKITEAARGGVEIPGFKLQPGAVRREVTDGMKAWTAMKDYLTVEEFSALCKVSVTDLEDAIHKNMKVTTPKFTKKEATALVESRLMSHDAIDFKRGQSYLKPTKEDR